MELRNFDEQFEPLSDLFVLDLDRLILETSMASILVTPVPKNSFTISTFLSGKHGYHKLVSDGRELVADGAALHLGLYLSNIQAITVRTVCGKEFQYQVGKQQIAKKGDGLVELIFDGEELEDQSQIQVYCKNSDAVFHLLVKSPKVRAKPVEKDFEVLTVASDSNEKGADEVVTDECKQGTQPVHPLGALQKQFCRDIILEHQIANPDIELPSVIRNLIKSTFSGLDKGKFPVLCREGRGGTYLMFDPNGQDFISIFKPTDEEAMAVNNPKGSSVSKDGEGLRKGTQVGEGAIHEVAAYILDHPSNRRHSHCHEDFGFSGVPPTAFVSCLHKSFSNNLKIGSLQMYIKKSFSCEDRASSVFPVEEVHKISVLDIRLANVDRHTGNILYTRDHEGQFVLFPIDHGYCFPSKFEDCTFDWLNWPQAKQPYAPKTIEYIESLDAGEDITLLKLHGWDMLPECARILQVSTMLLKKGVARRLTPFVIGGIMCREPLDEKESVIELIVKEAEEKLLQESNETTFLETISSIMDCWLDELSL